MRPSRKQTGFSLIEMLVATAVLGVLMIMVTQLLSSAVKMSGEQHKRMNAEDQANLVFSRMALDFSKMLRRPDVDSIFAQNTGNDAFYFYSEAPAEYNSSSSAYTLTSGNSLLKNSVSLIGYRINSQYQLERLGKALNYDAGPPIVAFLTFPANSTTPLSASTMATVWAATLATGTSTGTTFLADSGFTNGTDPDFHVISDQVFRLEFCFQLTNGTYSTTHTSRDFSDVASVVVTIGILDSTSQRLIPSTSLISELGAMAGLLGDASSNSLQPSTGSPILPGQTWTSALNQTTTFAAAAGVPNVVAGQVRVYQHYFYLHSLQ